MQIEGSQLCCEEPERRSLKLSMTPRKASEDKLHRPE